MPLLGYSPLLWTAVILLLCCTLCLGMQIRAARRRKREEEEQLPLLSPERDDSRGSGSRGGSGGTHTRSDVAAIGTPARDFVRLSSLPATVFNSEDRRCMACSQTGEIVALRPCGHEVLCRTCSDFVYTCPHCGQYISGVVAGPNQEPSGLRPR